MPETYALQHSPVSDAVDKYGAAPKSEDIKGVESIQNTEELNPMERNATDLQEKHEESFKLRQMPGRKPVVRKFENRTLQMNQHHAVIDHVVNTDPAVHGQEVTDECKTVSRDDDHERLKLGDASKTGRKVLAKPAADKDRRPFPVAIRTATEKQNPQKLQIPNAFH